MTCLCAAEDNFTCHFLGRFVGAADPSPRHATTLRQRYVDPRSSFRGREASKLRCDVYDPSSIDDKSGRIEYASCTKGISFGGGGELIVSAPVDDCHAQPRRRSCIDNAAERSRRRPGRFYLNSNGTATEGR
jgi:hypothetical protein